MSGPMADARMKIERTICVSKSVSIERSDFIIAKAGATMDDDTGETNMNNEFRMVMRHRLLFGQFLGFSGSSRPFQSTTWLCHP
jgi:hypothetical protein